MKRLRNSRLVPMMVVCFAIVFFVFSASPADANGLKSKLKKLFNKCTTGLFKSVSESMPDYAPEADIENLLREFQEDMEDAIEDYDKCTNIEEVVEDNGGTKEQIKTAKKIEKEDDECSAKFKTCLDACVAEYKKIKSPTEADLDDYDKCTDKCEKRLEKCNDLSDEID